MKRDDRERLDDIAETIRAIKTQAANKRVDQRLRHDAILYNLLIVGEAVKTLGDETKTRRPEIPWRPIAGLRDRLAHEHYRIEMGEIESIIEHDLGPLATAIGGLRRSPVRRIRTSRPPARRFSAPDYPRLRLEARGGSDGGGARKDGPRMDATSRRERLRGDGPQND